MIRSSLTAVCSETRANTLTICYTTRHSAIIGKFSTRRKKKGDLTACQHEMFHFLTHAFIFLYLHLYLDPGDEQEKVYRRKSTCSKYNSGNMEQEQQKKSISCPIFLRSRCRVRALYSQRGRVCKRACALARVATGTVWVKIYSMNSTWVPDTCGIVGSVQYSTVKCHCL